ncbi:MAG TPA: hypothetical protein VI643_02010 [Planctomycetota bacterium]|nr:hypothetical protein [Planctomycetota bacterium]
MKVKAILGVLILTGLFAASVQADIVPNEPEPSANDPAAREAVRRQLDTLGVSALEAKMIAENLSAGEARFFAESERANGVAAGLWLEEWIGAAIYLIILGPTIEKNVRRYVLLETP